MLCPNDIKKTLVGNITYLGGSRIKGVVWEDIDQPRISDSGVVYLPRMDAMMDGDDLTLYLYKVYHEMGHAVAPYNGWGKVLKENRPSSTLQWIYNVMDDHGQERNLMGTFKMVDTILLEGRKIFLERNKDSIPIMDDDETKRMSIWIMDNLTRRKWNTPLALQPLPSIPDGVGEYMDVIEETYKRILDVRCTEDMFSLAKEVFSLLWPDEDGEAPPPEGGEGEEGEGGERNGEIKDGLPEEEGGEESYSRDGEGYKENPLILLDMVEPVVLEGNGVVVMESIMKRKEYLTEWRSLLESSIQEGGSIIGEAKRLLLARSQRRNINGQRSGKLSSKNLWKYRHSDRVFAKKEELLDHNVVVSILVDYSASMSGRRGNKSKDIIASAASGLLTEACNVLGINVELAVFTEGNEYGGTVHGLIQPFGKKWSRSLMVDGFTNGRCVLNQNADGESVGVAASRLLTQSQKRKILFVLSDGCPLAHNTGDLNSHLRYIIRKIRETDVELYGIGLMDDSVKRFYPEYTVLNSMDDLLPCLSTLLKNKIFKI